MTKKIKIGNTKRQDGIKEGNNKSNKILDLNLFIHLQLNDQRKL